MPFGLKNSPISFQNLMSDVLREMNWKYALCYIDDILIFSRTFEDHLVHLNAVFEKLRNAGLTLKPSKCHFAAHRVEYLGHVLSKDGIRVNPEKTDAVRNFPVPKSVRDVRSFIGLCNYYRKFVKDFSRKASPLNSLTKKDLKFAWTDQCQEAFDTLKHDLTTAPMLHYPDMNSEFVLSTDASDIAISYILGQKDHTGKEWVVSYGGRSLCEAKRKWTVSEKECLAVISGIEAYRKYLANSKFTVYTDHKALQWFRQIKNPNNRLERWSMELQEYDFTIIHKIGIKNQNADALSRRVNDLQKLTH